MKFYEIRSDLEKILLDFCDMQAATPVKSKAFKRLAERVRALSDAYTEDPAGMQTDVFSAEQMLKAYVLYYLPVNLVKLFPVLDELKGLPLFTKKYFTMLDLGCGPGTYTLGMLENIAAGTVLQKATTVRLFGIDREQQSARAAQKLTQDYVAGKKSTLRKEWQIRFTQGLLDPDVLRYERIPKCNLIMAGNVVNELDSERFGEFAVFLEQQLATNGAVIVLDPGTRASFRKLLKLKEEISTRTSLHLYAPCIQPGTCPLAADKKAWCHEKVFWKPPPVVQALDRLTGFTKEKGLKYSYFTFLKQPAGLRERFPKVEPGSIWRVISYVMKHKGENRLYVCNGQRRVLLRRLRRNTTPENADFDTASRGQLVWFEGGITRGPFLDITKESRFRIL